MKRYFALVQDGVVTQVIVAKESPGEDWLETWKDGSRRGNYAGVGMLYDVDLDVFYAPKPYPSWNLDETYRWRPPIEYPLNPALTDDGGPVFYTWDEEAGDWVEMGA